MLAYHGVGNEASANHSQYAIRFFSNERWMGLAFDIAERFTVTERLL